MMTTAHDKNGDDKSDHNKDKVYLLFKDNVSGSHVRSRARSHDFRSYDHGIIF